MLTEPGPEVWMIDVDVMGFFDQRGLTETWHWRWHVIGRVNKNGDRGRGGI